MQADRGGGCYIRPIISALWPDTVFLFLINSSGAVFLFVYLMICVSQIKLRSRWEREGVLKFKMWGHPWLPLLVTGTVVAVLVSMAIDSSTQASLLQSLLAWAVILGAFGILQFVRNRSGKSVPMPASKSDLVS